MGNRREDWNDKIPEYWKNGMMEYWVSKTGKMSTIKPPKPNKLSKLRRLPVPRA
jgi:hypothetical protein